MKTGLLIKILGTCFVMALCLVITLWMLHRFENPSSEFASYSDLAASGLIQQGWVPKIIPRSAYAISETHNLDTNVVRLWFSFAPGDTELAEAQCEPIQATVKARVFRCAGGLLTLGSDGAGFFTDGVKAAP
jgi:hypothetical protein